MRPESQRLWDAADEAEDAFKAILRDVFGREAREMRYRPLEWRGCHREAELRAAAKRNQEACAAWFVGEILSGRHPKEVSNG